MSSIAAGPLVGAGKEGFGNRQPKLAGGLRVDDKSKGGRLAEGEVCYCRALEDTIYVTGEQASQVVEVNGIGGKAAHSHRSLSRGEERGYFFFRREGEATGSAEALKEAIDEFEIREADHWHLGVQPA
jgi:hypothetical protein